MLRYLIMEHTIMINSTIAFQQAILKLSCNLHLPSSNEEDLQRDSQILNNFSGCDFVWLLREKGTTLLPLKIGANPDHITYFVEGDRAQVMHAFHFKSQSGAVEKISLSEAERLVYQSPTEISLTMTLDKLVAEVDAVLTRGKQFRLWGNSHSAIYQEDVSWSEWKAFFEAHHNSVMLNLMARALQYLSEHKRAA